MIDLKHGIDRRRFLAAGGVAASWGLLPKNIGLGAFSPAPRKKKRVAAVVTIYTHNSHADVLLGKILKGWKCDGGLGPDLELASLYVDQFPQTDMARALAAEHGFPICDTIDEAITLGGDKLAVDGVISVGEHGDYPRNEKGQHLYPRRRFFSEITDTFQRCGEVRPVFTDKHMGPVWSDAKWMYNRAREMNIPLMAGSSIPVSFRSPDVSIPLGSQIEACLGFGYADLDAYGFHALEFLQCFLERRKGAETGVRWVRCLPGESLKELTGRGVVRRDLLDAAVAATLKSSSANIFDVDPSRFTIFLVQYRDGLLAPLLMLTGFAAANTVALRVRGQKEPLACRAEERSEPRYPHFAYLLKGIEKMMHTGKPAYPVERTLLTGGILDALLTSKANNGQKLLTPELGIRYQGVDYPHAPHLDLTAAPV